MKLYRIILPVTDIESAVTFYSNIFNLRGHRVSLYIAVNNLDQIHQKIKNSNCQHVDEKIEIMPWGERLFYSNDPFGNPVCFVDESTLFTGEGEDKT